MVLLNFSHSLLIQFPQLLLLFKKRSACFANFKVSVFTFINITMAMFCPSSSRQSMLPEIFFVLLPFIGLASADLLKNLDFESPPLNFPANSNLSSVKLNENNTIPGWAVEGEVEYVRVGKNISLPENGHAILLGEDGKINQTFIANEDFLNYLLTFALAPGGEKCSATARLEVSAPDFDAFFTLNQSYGKEPWKVFGSYLGSWRDGDPVNLIIGSQSTDSNSTPTCWPVIDSLIFKSMGIVMPDSGNLLVNGGFEFGPDFLPNTAGGILMDSAPTPVFSPLRQWAIFGTVRYIDSKHFFVPKGNAAVEFVSGVSSGIQAQTAEKLKEGSSYNLDFMLGDANDSCTAKFLVGVQAGSTYQNFTLESNGTGSAVKFSVAFKAIPDVNTITFLSYTTSQTKDGDFCGPVIDDVIVRVSHGLRISMPWMSLIPLYLVTIFCLL